LSLALAEEGGPEVLPSLAAEGGKIQVLSRSFGVASEVKGLLDDCKKLAMNRLYLMNVLGNLPLCLLLNVCILLMSLLLLC
jgi:hypothetical protein